MSQQNISVDLSQLANYKADLDKAVLDMASIKFRIENLRLSLRQTKEAAARVKSSVVVRQIAAFIPQDFLVITPAPGVVYITIQIPANQKSRYLPQLEALDVVFRGIENPGETDPRIPTVRRYTPSNEPGFVIFANVFLHGVAP